MSDTSNHQPVGIDPDSRPAFLFDNDTLGVDTTDPIYQQVVEAMKANGMETPPPATTPRPPEMDPNAFSLDDEGNVVVTPPVVETPPVADGAQIPPVDTGAPSSSLTDSRRSSGEPSAEGVVTSAAPSAETGEEQPPKIDVEFGGQTYSLGREEVDYLLQQNAWMQSLPEDLKQQWAGVQDGNLVAISREEYEALKQQTATPPPAAPVTPDLTYVDEDVREYIQRLQSSQQAPAAVQQPSYDQGPSAAEMQAAATREAERQMRIRGEISTATETFTAEYGLTPEQAQRLQSVTVNLGVVPTLSRQRAVYSPMGQLIAEAPMDQVMKQAYEIAMNTDPELKNIRDERVFNERLAAQHTADQRVNGKKALAGSLASAPSAAVPASSGQSLAIGPNNQMNMQATSEAMARAIAEAQSQGV